jgi:hypothetical protein
MAGTGRVRQDRGRTPPVVIHQSVYEALPLFYQALVDVLQKEGITRVIREKERIQTD